MKRIAIAQLSSSIGKRENLKAAAVYIREAKGQGATLIAFPEFLMAYSPPEQSAEELCRIAEGVEGEFVSTLREAARANEIGVVATLYEKSEIAGRVYDTAVLIDRSGDIASIYRKLHLYDALGFKESDKLAAGADLARPADAEIGPIGLMICYDIRFPELARILALMGAEILVLPSGWVKGEQKVEHWRTMLRARAIENGCFVAAPDQVGHIYVGHSMVIDPFGRTVLDMEEREGLGLADLDEGLLTEVREKLPLLKNRRADVYARHLKP